METRIYKEVFFDATHRLLHYQGKCSRLHGHRWRVQVWMAGEPNPVTGILVDYNLIKEVIERFDHGVILNREDPMAECLRRFHEILTTEGDPSSETLAAVIEQTIGEECRRNGNAVRVTRIRVWESDTCYAERDHEGR